MKEEILHRLMVTQKKIGSMIEMVEDSKPAQTIIPKIDSVLKELRDIEKLMLKSHLGTILKQAGLRKNKQENILKLCGF